MDAENNRTGSSPVWGLPALFLLSGACGLVYQVLWARMLIVVFGATLPAVSTVLSAFMAGLALGSFCFGRWIDGVRRPLLVFACLEAGVGLFAFLFPHLLATTGWLAEAEWTEHNPSAFAAARFALAFGLLLIPTAAMGATLPVISRSSVRRFRKLGSGVGLLYAANTLGAVAADKKVKKLPPLMQELLVDKLRADLGATFRTEKTVKAFVRDALMSTIGEKPTPLVNAVVNALAVRDPDAPVITAKGKPKPDPTLRDYENVPLPPKRVTHETDTSRRLDTTEYQTAIDNYLQEEVHPYVPNAWHDPTKTKIGYEIPLTRHFYTYTPPRPPPQIDNEIKTLETEIQVLLAEMTA